MKNIFRPTLGYFLNVEVIHEECSGLLALVGLKLSNANCGFSIKTEVFFLFCCSFKQN